MDEIKRNYSFGNINVTLNLPWSLICKEPFSLFANKENIKDGYICNIKNGGEKLFEFDGEEIYNNVSQHIRVTKKNNITAVYLGYYKNAKENNREYAVIIRDENEKNVQDVFILEEFLQEPNERQIMSAIGIEHIVVAGGGLILHSSYIETPFGGVLFTAPKQTGKSTQATLWEKYENAEILNGDRALVSVKGNAITVSGVPYSGSSGICKNKTLPIAAIVELSQAKENKLTRLSGAEGVKVLLSGTWANTWDSEDMTKITDTAIKIAQNVPMFHLSCLPDKEAVAILKEELKKGKR